MNIWEIKVLNILYIILKAGKMTLIFPAIY